MVAKGATRENPVNHQSPDHSPMKNDDTASIKGWAWRSEGTGRSSRNDVYDAWLFARVVYQVSAPDLSFADYLKV